MEYERRVGSAEAKAIRHGRLDAGILDTARDKWHFAKFGVGLIAIDRGRNEIVVEHKQAMNRLVDAGCPQGMTAKRLG